MGRGVSQEDQGRDHGRAQQDSFWCRGKMTTNPFHTDGCLAHTCCLPLPSTSDHTWLTPVLWFRAQAGCSCRRRTQHLERALGIPRISSSHENLQCAGEPAVSVPCAGSVRLSPHPRPHPLSWGGAQEKLEEAGFDLTTYYKNLDKQTPEVCETEVWKNATWAGVPVTLVAMQGLLNAEEQLKVQRPVKK